MPDSARLMSRIRGAFVGAALVAVLTATGCSSSREPASVAGGGTAPAMLAASATYVGRGRCVTCHQEENARYQGSHHDLAMQEATPATVLGDFSDATFSYAGTVSRFTTRDGKYIVTTDGPDGRVRDFEVAYVFGVYPLQQYLIGFPDGRYQALSIAWDARPKAQGGQRWYHLYPDEKVTHTDVLHWTRFSQNWNAQCATCHSTNLRKAYDRATDTYKTTWSELDVSCESCHGPASAHVAWAERHGPGKADPSLSATDLGLTVSLRERRGATWTMQGTRGIAARTPAPGATRAEVEICAPCHARRAERVDAHVPGQPLLMSYRPTFLSAGLYRPDGQMEDEVYNYGSFLQSRMHAAGVTCSDCHDPHSLKQKGEGNGVCAQCHLPTTFDVRSHHGHEPGTPGASCVACHMPTVTYMGVDARHDHSFRVPRPDFSERFGTPDTCTSCHKGKTPAWAAAALDRWRTPAWRQRPHFAPAFAAAAQGRVDAAGPLRAIASDATQPAITRATALEWLSATAPEQAEQALDALARDPQPLVRLSVAQGLSRLEPAARARVGGALLEDPMRVIRLDAASALAGEPAQWLPAGQRAALERAMADLRTSEVFNGDRPESYVNLALMEERRGNVAGAIAEYEAATRYAPWFLPAYVNLAELQRQGGDEVKAEATLRRALVAVPGDPGVLYALGLSVYRQQRALEAVDLLKQAAARGPEVPRYPFAYALALESQRKYDEALAVIDAALVRHPDNRDLLDAGLGIAQKASDVNRARGYVRRLLLVVPGDPALVQLARTLGVR
ncbi:tetratricopeptide repeat protein [Luteitalea sp. TBR-22]|uniref:tetratricopeptide repeat protein n=1 Tax=Luteitalea sp. TBR-22 TaxID=2802971 RepID=UPI001EF66073|nr:tetratricopeptide repeat protein [Luteitalea sp. TBR-22]